MGKPTDKQVVWDNERKKTNRTALFSIALAVIMILTFFAGYFVRGTVEPAESQEMSALMRIITERWMSQKNTEELSADFINLVIKPYDAYATYYTPQEYKKLVEEDKGRYSGVGIALRENSEGYVQVAKVYLNSPAYKNGVETGDVLVAGIKKGETEYTVFQDEISEGKTALSVVNDLFAGYSIGDTILLKFQSGSAEPKEITLEKEDYIVSYVEYMDNEKYYYFSSTKEDGFHGRESTDIGKILPTLNDDTAYIKLYEFEGDAAKQFEKALDYMVTERHRKKLILDLRDNGGGILDILMDIASYLVTDKNADKLLVLKSEDKNSLTRYTKVKRFKGLTDVSVIANAGTASAAECLIGALIDYGNKENYGGIQFDYSRLILTPKQIDGQDVYRTYGKGIMQTTYSLPSGGALKLTTAKIYWPHSVDENGKPFCVQDRGVTDGIKETDENAINRANEVLH